jgi:hypothetical protein
MDPMSSRKSKPTRKSRAVVVRFTTGFEAPVKAGQTAEDLFTAIGTDTGLTYKGELIGPERWEAILVGCIMQLHYVCGQLRWLGFDCSASHLEQEFRLIWEGKLKEKEIPHKKVSSILEPGAKLTVLRKAPKKKTTTGKAPAISLVSGYEVRLEGDDSLERLCNAILGEKVANLRPKPKDAAAWFEIFSECLKELHFVGGQLLALGFNLPFDRLQEEFGVYWDDVAERTNRRNRGVPD